MNRTIWVTAILVTSGAVLAPAQEETPPRQPTAREQPPAATRGSPSAPARSSAPAVRNDERDRRLVVGTWKDEYKGKRTLTLKEDGSGTMVVELSGLQASLFAARLKFDMRWSLKDGRLKKRTTGGEPAVKVQLILSTMGDRVDEQILELTDKRLLLLDQDGKTKYDWRRVMEDQRKPVP